MWFLDTNGDHAWNGTPTDEATAFGTTGDRPVVPDFLACQPNFLPVVQPIAVVRASTWLTTMNNHIWETPSDSGNTFSFGTNPIPLYWNHAAVAFQSGTWFVDADQNGTWSAGDQQFSFGQVGDLPVLGAWGASSPVSMGVYRNGTWFLDLDHTNSWTTGDGIFSFGSPGDYPVAADFNPAISGTEIGTFRNGSWFIDMNGNRQWDGVQGGDVIWTFGQAGDVPVIARGTWVFSGPCTL